MKLILAAIISFSLFAAGCKSTTAQHSADGFKSIFDGKSLKGWKGDTYYWKVENGSIVGEVTDKPLTTNTFLIYQESQPADFELKAEFKISASGNSGIQYRSELFDTLPFALKGYQADIDGKDVYTGLNYEERGRGFLAKRGEISVMENGKPAQITGSLGSSDSLKALIHANDWNQLHIIAKGNHMQHYINGVLMSEVTDNDTDKRKMQGLLGLQAHVGPPMRVEYRNILIK